jgi:HEAT repeat protein
LTPPQDEDNAQDRADEARDRAEEARDRAEEARDRADEERDRIDEAYERGSEQLDQNHWQAAIGDFDQIAATSSHRADGALYWKAFAQNKLGQRTQALATLDELKRRFPQSNWMKDAAALRLEVQQANGQPVSPQAQSNNDLKLLAINSLMNSDPKTAVPLLEQLIQGPNTPQLKERALFVLSQSELGREAVARIARTGNDGLREKAIQDLGLFGGESARGTLADIYKTSNDADVKRGILHAYMLGGDRDRLLEAARTEKNTDLRRDAIHLLGLTGGRQQLLDLYKVEPATELRQAIAHALFLDGAAEQLNQIALTDRDPEVRQAAIHSLGLMGGERTGEMLVSIYKNEKSKDAREAAIQGLFLQSNAHALIEIARGETDPELKRTVVSKLALIHSPEATKYMMEILSK